MSDDGRTVPTPFERSRTWSRGRWRLWLAASVGWNSWIFGAGVRRVFKRDNRETLGAVVYLYLGPIMLAGSTWRNP